MCVRVEARLDGQEYPVTGSPGADTITYTRDGELSIRGIGNKNGEVTLRETLAADPRAELIQLTYTVYNGGRELASGRAVFRRLAGAVTVLQ